MISAGRIVALCARHCKPGGTQHGGYVVEVAGAKGLEPSTSAVTGQRSNQLSYAPANGTDLRPALSQVKNSSQRTPVGRADASFTGKRQDSARNYRGVQRSVPT